MKTQVAIVGGGPGGTASAMFLARRGIDTVLIEKEQFPRYHIGESMTGECGALLRELGFEDRLLSAGYPKKRGVTVYGASGKNAWYVPVMGKDAAGKLYEQYTWQVRRSEFDGFMLEEAVARGANLVPGQATRALQAEDGAVRGVEVRMADGGVQEVEADLVLDCSGLSTFLANSGVTGPKYQGNYDKQIAIFSQVANTVRDEGKGKDDTLIFYQEKYHWAWFIPLDDEVVSVGVVIPSAYFLSKRESKEDFLRRELHELNPELRRRVPDNRLIEEARAIVNYSYQVRRFGGPGYLCVGDAHRFLDPIFSFGLYVTVKEASLMAPVVQDYLEGVGRDSDDPFAQHQVHCEQGMDVLEDALDCFWENPLAFALLVHNRYIEEMIDVFAGRIYDGQPARAIDSMRKLLGRDRSDAEGNLYSVPIGSRFHPERAAIWKSSGPDESAL